MPEVPLATQRPIGVLDATVFDPAEQRGVRTVVTRKMVPGFSVESGRERTRRRHLDLLQFPRAGPNTFTAQDGHPADWSERNRRHG